MNNNLRTLLRRWRQWYKYFVKHDRSPAPNSRTLRGYIDAMGGCSNEDFIFLNEYIRTHIDSVREELQS